ncbi:hypothetical protein PR202_gb17637 [Eleusine coracana subsp. coracana]|uniref:Tac7077 n=1 Tax=Eleusine coracana subsp. coracana TaxID=191504 RepID=A0AAV5F3K1_ELECO|nr:hypothetical protein PR202_gb17637 [Eleusine coracana subsp. coracana]
MLSRGAVRSLLDRLRSKTRGWNPAPAMPPPPSAAANRACLCSFSQSVAQGRKPGFVDLGAGRRFAPAGALSLKGCQGWQDGEGGGFRRWLDGDVLGIKAQVLTTPRQLLRDPEVLPLEEVGGKSLNGNGACRRGKPLGFPEHPGAAKMVVAVDVDEVLGSFLAALNKFIADRYSWNHSVSEYHVYEFFRVNKLYGTVHEKELPFVGLNLSALAIPRCRSFGAQVLIDDNPRYALECAEEGMRVLLFDYDNSYPWCKTGVDESHPLVTKVHNWEEVEEKLLSWVVPES